MKLGVISKGFLKRVLLALGVLAGIVVLCLIDGFLVEPYFPRVIRQDVCIEGLPKSLDGLKIVHLSDLHIVKYGKREARAERLIGRIKPDLVCLTGDYVEDDGITPGNHPWRKCAKESARFMSGLHGKYGVYAARGNWDPREITPYLQKAGVRVLDGESVTLKIRGEKLRIAGNSSTIMSTASLPYSPLDDVTTIVLDHFPESADDLANRTDVDLVLSGHWHGGQVGWPLKMTDVKYLAGFYRVGNLQLYVTRGLGMHTKAVRFDCPAEITLIVLKAA